MSKKNDLKRAEIFALKNFNDNLEISNSLKDRELKQNKEIAEKELAVKDRVDISLEEYKELCTKLKELEDSNRRQKELLDRLHIEEYFDFIDFDSVEVRTDNDELRMKQKIFILFDVKYDF